ncbi:hypothetical protein BGZ76_001448 [Entomortierella beljakovae]|nr:hypothetical protein BGZ76_001448 [Entomortierella beljakovae]
MISIRRVASSLPRHWHSISITASYTTGSNGSAFHSNLGFLAPTSSQSNSVQQSKTNKFQSQQPSNSNSRDSFTSKSYLGSNTSSGNEDIADVNLKAPPTSKRPNWSKQTNSKDDSSDKKSKGVVLDRSRRDEEITSQWIQYISPEGNQGEKRLSGVLKTFDRAQYYLVEVDPNANPPICKLFSKKELYMKAKQAKQSKKANLSTLKELQIGWGTDPHDLEHKLSKFKAFLEKGYRLEIQLNGKRGKNTNAQEREAMLEKVKSEFEPVSKYVRNPEWVKANTVTMLLQGVVQKDQKEKKEKKET